MTRLSTPAATAAAWRGSGTVAVAGFRAPAFERVRDARAMAVEYFARCALQRTGEVHLRGGAPRR